MWTINRLAVNQRWLPLKRGFPSNSHCQPRLLPKIDTKTKTNISRMSWPFVAISIQYSISSPSTFLLGIVPANSSLFHHHLCMVRVSSLFNCTKRLTINLTSNWQPVSLHHRTTVSSGPYKAVWTLPSQWTPGWNLQPSTFRFSQSRPSFKYK